MATNNAPKHDFAPAWLKIPNSENSKPSGTKQGETSLDDRVHCRNIIKEDTSHFSDYNKLCRQHSCDHCSEGSKRYPPGPSNKFRHHSVDDDYYAYGYPYGYYNGYGYHEKYSMHYSSQPSLVRANGQRDSKYQHPHARYGATTGMTVGYPPYYDFLPYDYYGNDPYYKYPSGSGRGSSGRRGYYEKESRSNSKEGKDKKKDKDGEKEKPFTDDFPSLNGEEKLSKGSKQVNGTGVWDNPPKSKNGNVKSGDDNFETSQTTKVLRDTNIYKNLVPTKTTSLPRRPARLNGSVPRDQGSFAGLKHTTPTSSSSSPGLNKEGGSQPSTPPIDIHNTRFVTQPKTLSDKKSHFLKALRQEDERTDKKGHCGEPDDLMNGVAALRLSEDDSHLSSSLEAEQRLLREMGWNEADEDEYEITEDDMKQFQTLSKQLHNQRTTNGLRNGIVKPSIPKTWSPKHIPLYQPNPTELNDTVSSSDSDSDEAAN